MGMVYVIGAAKGGTAKTVTTYNLAYSLVELGMRVLCVDMDPQANLTTCFGVENSAEIEVTMGDLLMALLEDEDLPEREEYVWERNGVDFIPSSMMLSGVEAKLRMEMGTEKMLGMVLEQVRDDYECILVDTCPSMGALTINALSAADKVIVTVNPQLLAMKGLQDFLKTVNKVRHRMNGTLEVEGILLTMCERRTNLCRMITEEMRETFDGKIRVFDHVIPNTVKVGESVFYGEPLLEYASGTEACEGYQRLAEEIVGEMH